MCSAYISKMWLLKYHILRRWLCISMYIILWLAASLVWNKSLISMEPNWYINCSCCSMILREMMHYNVCCRLDKQGLFLFPCLCIYMHEESSMTGFHVLLGPFNFFHCSCCSTSFFKTDRFSVILKQITEQTKNFFSSFESSFWQLILILTAGIFFFFCSQLRLCFNFKLDCSLACLFRFFPLFPSGIWRSIPTEHSSVFLWSLFVICGFVLCRYLIPFLISLEEWKTEKKRTMNVCYEHIMITKENMR